MPFLATKQQKCRTVDLKQQKTAYTLLSCRGEVLSNWKVLGMIVFVMQTLKLNEKLICFSMLAVFLCRSNLRLIFLVDSSLAVFWVSLKFEERSEDTANFPLTLNNFFTSCAEWHKRKKVSNDF